MRLRADQQAAVTVYGRSTGMFLQMPTGSGKTVTAAAMFMSTIGQQNSGVWVVGQQNLVSQAAGEFLRLSESMGATNHDHKEAKNGYILEFTYRGERARVFFFCWQSFCKKAAKWPNPGSTVLFFDECHSGSSGDVCASMREVLRHPWRRVVALSATPWDLNREVYEGRAMDSYTLSMLDAIEQRIILPVDMVMIETGMTVYLDDGTEVSGDSALETARNAVEHAAENESVVDTGGGQMTAAHIQVMKAVVNAVGQAEPAYDEDGLFRPILFITKTTEYAEQLGKEIAHIWASRWEGLAGAAVCRVVHQGRKSSHDDIRAFQAGEFPVLVSVAMAREGMNYPRLSVVVDVGASPRQNPKATTQGMGRTTRLYPEKFVGSYYYTRWPGNIIRSAEKMRVNGVAHDIDPKVRDAAVTYREGVDLSAEFKQGFDDSSAQALTDCLQVQAGAQHGNGEFTPDTQIAVPTIEVSVTQPQGDAPGAMLYRVSIVDVDGNFRMTRASLSDFVRKSVGAIDPEGNKAAIWEWSRKNGRRPSQNSKDLEEKRLGGLLSSYRRDLDFRAGYEAEFPKLKDSDRGKREVWEWSRKNGRRPSQNSKDLEEKRLGGLLSRYCKDPEFRAQYEAEFPKLFDKERGKREVWEWSRKNGRRPSQTSKDPDEKRLGKLLSNYCKDPEFRAGYEAEFPSRRKK